MNDLTLDQQIRAVLDGYDHDAAGQIDHLTKAIRAVLDLHHAWGPLCAVCHDITEPDGHAPYPCLTVQALTGILQETT